MLYIPTWKSSTNIGTAPTGPPPPQPQPQVPAITQSCGQGSVQPIVIIPSTDQSAMPVSTPASDASAAQATGQNIQTVPAGIYGQIPGGQDTGASATASTS